LLYGKLALSSIYTGDNTVDIAAITGSGNLKRYDIYVLKLCC